MKISKKVSLIIGLFVLPLSFLVTSFFHAQLLSAQEAAPKAKCYSYEQGTTNVQRAPAGVCNYDLMKSGGFTMGSLPNPLPDENKCYLWPDTGDPKEVNCDESTYKNAPEWGSKFNLGAAIQNIPTPAPVTTNTQCPARGTFFSIPTWYQFLPPGKNCSITLQKTDASGNPEFDGGKNVWDLNKIWLVGLGIADILLTLAGLIAVFFVIAGGYKYITSQFDPEGTKKAKDTILNALIGLIIAILSTALVNFIGKTLQ